MSLLNGLPNWAIEVVVAGGVSVLLAIIYAWILFHFKDYKNSIKRMVNIVLAIIGWGALMYEKIQQGMEELRIPFDESPLFYVAVAVAVVSLVHTCVEALEKD